MTLRISATADYALRAVVALASQPGPCRGRDLAARAGIPPAYVDNVMRPLRTAGLVDSRRGTTGGYWLTRDAADVTVADVVAAVDLPGGDGGPARSPVESSSPFDDLWRAAVDAQLDALRSTTIADVVAREASS